MPHFVRCAFAVSVMPGNLIQLAVAGLRGTAPRRVFILRFGWQPPAYRRAVSLGFLPIHLLDGKLRTLVVGRVLSYHALIGLLGDRRLSQPEAFGDGALAGRKRIDVGKQANPVLLLTATELFGQYKIIPAYEMYGEKKEMAERVYRRGDIQETCDFTQQLYLGIESYYTWRDKKRQSLIARRTARKSAKA